MNGDPSTVWDRGEGGGGEKDTDLHIEYVDMMVLRANIFSLKKSCVCVRECVCENLKFVRTGNFSKHVRF